MGGAPRQAAVIGWPGRVYSSGYAHPIFSCCTSLKGIPGPAPNAM